MVASLDHGEAIQAVFNRCDADKSGSIDVNELGKCMRLLGMNPTEAEVVAAMESVDENKNGKLEFDEFRGLMEPRLSEWLQNDQVKVLTDCFKVFDTEGTGKISKEMLSHIMTSQGDKLTEAELDRMMKAADSDGDGMIDYQEFVINHFFGPNSRVSTGTWGSLSWSGSVSGHISNAYTAASESVNAAVANVPSVGEMVDSAKNVADSAATKAQEMVANAPSKEAVVEGIKDAASNAATVAGEAVAVTRDAIAEQAAQAAAAVAPPAAQEQDVAQEVSAEAPPAAEPAEVPEVEEGKKEEPPAAGQAVVYEYGANISDFWQVFYAVRGASSFFSAVETYKRSQQSLSRVEQLQDAFATLDEEKQAQTISCNPNPVEHFEQGRSSIETPTGTPLLAGLTFKVESGRHLVICGHNGAGKSSIFRCLAGLWPVAKGTITCPNACSSGLHRDVYYLSQRPMNIVGTLSDQLTYPTPVPGGLSAQDLRQWLAYVGMAHFVDRAESKGTLQEEADWGSRLSLSEQQRLGIARVLYHRPKFAVLDECTSAVSKDLEHWLFQASPKRLFSRSAVLSE
ncbi:unnamed protein product [Durusdinium trenchii]|uniref:EF-hand domain-containing protein n=1 Tax=Durusdinium trenchii TaxID=1381693 RepID=A0ABP0KIW5_9DINO